MSLDENNPFLKQLNTNIDDIDKRTQVEHRLLDDMEKECLGTLPVKSKPHVSINQKRNYVDFQHREEIRKRTLSNSSKENYSTTNNFDIPLIPTNISKSIIKLNNQIKSDFITHCLSFINEDEEAMNCFQIVWTKYLQSVGDVSLLSVFFDTLPHSIKLCVIPKYQNDLIKWCEDLFHIECEALLCTIYYSESFQRVIRLALKFNKKLFNENHTNNKKGIIYVSTDFDPQLKDDLIFTVPNICFSSIQTDLYHENVLNIEQLEQTIIKDIDSTNEYPLMIIANVGTPFLGHVDELAKLKLIANHHQIWLHATGDLLGSLALLSTKDDFRICCDSLTLDLIKLFGIQNLSYLTLFVRESPFIPSLLKRGSSTTSQLNESHIGSDITLATINDNQTINNNNNNNSEQSLMQQQFAQDTREINYNSSSQALSTSTLSFQDMILHSPSISFISIWSLSRRCTNEHILHHMKHSFHLTDLVMKSLYQIKSIKILNKNSFDTKNGEINDNRLTYAHICDGYLSTTSLPMAVVLFRFDLYLTKIEHVDNVDDNDFNSYMDLLNIWLYDKLNQQYPKMNLELLKSTRFEPHKSIDDEMNTNRGFTHALRFAPLEHLLDVIEENYIKMFLEDVIKFCEILLATITARQRLHTTIKANYPNLTTISLLNWAGIGGVQYVPVGDEQDQVDNKQQYEQLTNSDNIYQQQNITSNLYSIQDINTINAELARKLQTNDSAFSLGVNKQEMFYLRLGMVRKNDDLDILLKKIQNSGQETEQSLKYVEVMAEKVREGIRQAEKGLQNENQQLLSQEGILRQLPIVSNLLSWWSPSISPTIKGLSFDLKSGALESTEPVHRYHMQIQNTSTIDQHDLQQQANMHREQSDSMAHQSENETSSSPSSIPITNEKNSQ